MFHVKHIPFHYVAVTFEKCCKPFVILWTVLVTSL